MWNDIREGSKINTYANYAFIMKQSRTDYSQGILRYSVLDYHSRKLFKWCLLRAFNQYLCMCLEVGGKGV